LAGPLTVVRLLRTVLLFFDVFDDRDDFAMCGHYFSVEREDSFGVGPRPGNLREGASGADDIRDTRRWTPRRTELVATSPAGGPRGDGGG
jgi:hypothetical protein